MNVWLSISSIVLIIVFGVSRIVKPAAPPRYSAFELERRIAEGDERAIRGRERRQLYPFIMAVRTLVSVILFVAMDGAISGLVGGVWAGVVSVLIVLAVAWAERWRRVRNLGQALGVRLRPSFLWLYAHRRYLFFLPFTPLIARAVTIHSEAELLHALDSASFLEPERRTLIHSALEFTGLTVSDAMSGRKSIKFVDKGEVLGPLLLDELYKTGKQAFVVADGSLDTVVGILKLERLTSLDMQDSPLALKAMSPDVQFIDEDASIMDALAYLRSSKAPFLVVQSADGATAGLLTMDNILRCLFEAA